MQVYHVPPSLCSGCSLRMGWQVPPESLLGCPHLTTGKQQDFWGSNPTQMDFPTVTAQGHPGAMGLPGSSPGSHPN